MVPSTTDFPGNIGVLDPDMLLKFNPSLRQADQILVAYSGGVDSSVLLFLLASLRASGKLAAQLRALHINHGIHQASRDWASHCADFCSQLDIPFEAVRVTVSPKPGESLEMAARNARYRIFEQKLGPEWLLLQGHHQGDQAETVLYRLMRGSGPAGLGSIPPQRPLGSGRLLRPLLPFSRESIMTCARTNALCWIEDPSNTDEAHDRNFLRSRVLPLLESRWPHAGAAISRAASMCREADKLLENLAKIDLQTVQAQPGNRLKIGELTRLDEVRQRNLLRYWLEHWSLALGGPRVSHTLISGIQQDIIPAAEDAEPFLQWAGDNSTLFVRRYRQQLYVLPPLPRSEAGVWDTGDSLALPYPLGTLTLSPTEGPGLPMDRLSQIEVRFRSGGETIKPCGRSTRTVKNLLQENGVPPWLRPHVPLLFCNGELVAVGDLAVSENWWCEAGNNNGRLEWKRADLDCGY